MNSLSRFPPISIGQLRRPPVYCTQGADNAMSRTDDSDVETSSTDSQSLSQLIPNRLNQAEYYGTFLQFDPDAPVSDDETVLEDLNWSLSALDAVIKYPCLVLWVRTRTEDLFVTYHSGEETHERSGYLRAATFTHEFNSFELNVEPDDADEAGLITQFEATNAVFDRVGGAHDSDEYSLLLADIRVITDIKPDLELHPIFDLTEHEIHWGLDLLRKGSFEFPRDRERTALHESVYLSEKYDDEFEHLHNAVDEHVTFGKPDS